MTPPELAYRGRQGASKSLERLVLRASAVARQAPSLSDQSITDHSLDEIRACVRTGGRDGAARQLLNDFRANGKDRFFEGPVNPQTPDLFAHCFSEACDRTRAAADGVCQHRFPIFGYGSLFFGDPVDWHLDPSSGRRAPLLHWSRIDPLDPKAVGDSKVIWELNRHQWLLWLGQAYRCTADERYAEVFASYIQKWMQANPRGRGINWSSSLEVAMRLISWCWALFLFKDSKKALSPALFVRMLAWIRAQASHVERYLSYYFSPNTHLTGEALGLLYVGTAFPALRDAARWRALGLRILAEQLERQVLPDGVHFEQSTCYQRYTVEIYLQLLMLAARNALPLPAAVGERVQRMLDFLLALRRPDGSLPKIGDADGGWLLPLALRSPDDVRGVFAVAAVIFGRSDYAWAAGGAAPETLWLLGPAGLAAYNALRPAPPAAAASRLFGDGGYAVMRSGWEADAHQLILDGGPLGCPVSSGHGHADLLSIQCVVSGWPYLVDPGTYCYTLDPSWRSYFRSTAAHSTIVVDGMSQAVPAGPFRWRTRPQARVRRWISRAAFDFVDAHHDAYRCLPDPVTHRRRVLFVKPRYWVAVDDLDGAAEHRIELRFQFAPMDLTLGPEHWARARGPEGGALLLRAFATVALEADVLSGELDPLQGWHSPDYGRRHPAPVLRYSTLTRLPLRIVTLLFPTNSPSAAPPAVDLFVSGALMNLAFPGWGDLVTIGEQDIIVERA